MPDYLTTLADQASSYSSGEIIAVLTAIGYIVLAIRQNIWCWACAGISTAIYVYLFFGARLYMESVLNVFYFGMAIYGWCIWHFGRTAERELAVTTWPISRHAGAILAIVTFSGVSGYLLQRYTEAAFPYIDSLTTWGAIWTTFLVARKVLENWWYWLVIDTAAIFIYFSRGLELTAVLFVVYVLMIPFGILSWRKSWRESLA